MAQSKQWKKAELEVAHLLKGSRTGPRGFGLPDVVLGSELAPEVKYMQRLSLHTAHLQQAQENMRNAGKSQWALFIREAKSGRRVVVVSYDYFADLYHATEYLNETGKYR